MRKKKKDWKKVLFSLDRDIIDKITELAELEGMTKTEFIEFLVMNWDKGIDPNAKLVDLIQKREKLQKEIAEIEQEIKKQTEYIKCYEKLKEQRIMKKREAIRVLKRCLLNDDFEAAEKYSKTWSRITGIPAIELMLEAKNQIEREEGI